ncbi:MAG: UTRA domain-containing protein [Holdemanella sp.]|nr:UTRA domain-containing protein [Holdemanella sp.]
MNREDVFIQRDLNCSPLVTNLLAQKYGDVEIEILEHGIVEANYYISKRLGVPLTSRVYCSSELVRVGNHPIAYNKYYIDMEQLMDLEDKEYTSFDLYRLISEKKNINYMTTKEEMLIVNANETEKKYLELTDEEEILLYKGLVSFEGEDRIFEYFESSNISTLYRIRSVGNNGSGN